MANGFQVGDIVRPTKTDSLGVVFGSIKAVKITATRGFTGGGEGRYQVKCLEGLGHGRRYISSGYYASNIDQPSNIKPGTKFVMTRQAMMHYPEYKKTATTSKKKKHPRRHSTETPITKCVDDILALLR